MGTYYLICKSEDGKYEITLRVVPAAFDKNIKKLVLDSKAAVNDKGYGERVIVGVTPRVLLNGSWKLGKKTPLVMGENIVKCGKGKASVIINPDGTALVSAMGEAKGKIKLNYSVNGISYSTTVNITKSKISKSKQKIRDKFIADGLLITGK